MLEVARLVIRMSESRSQKESIFGGRNKTTKKETIEFISKLVASKNGWHNTAVTNHILAYLGDEFYRQ